MVTFVSSANIRAFEQSSEYGRPLMKNETLPLSTVRILKESVAMAV